MFHRILIAFACLLTLAGCNGEIRSRIWTPEALNKEAAKPGGIRGVVGYYTKSAIEISQLTQQVDANGKSVAKPCRPINVQKVVTLTDYQHPVQIWYDYGILETNTFGVQFSNSVITAVNSQSTPDQFKTLANLGDAVTSFAKVAAPAVPASTLASPCNAGPAFVGYEKMPEIP